MELMDATIGEDLTNDRRLPSIAGIQILQLDAFG
jgi:hypothetical protein